MKTIEERLRDAKNDIVLIIATLSADPKNLLADDDELDEAALSAAARLREELHWLQQLPAEILNTGAPDADEQEKAGGAR